MWQLSRLRRKQLTVSAMSLWPTLELRPLFCGYIMILHMLFILYLYLESLFRGYLVIISIINLSNIFNLVSSLSESADGERGKC